MRSRSCALREGRRYACCGATRIPADLPNRDHPSGQALVNRPATDLYRVILIAQASPSSRQTAFGLLPWSVRASSARTQPRGPQRSESRYPFLWCIPFPPRIVGRPTGGDLTMTRLLDGIREIDAANFFAGPVSTTI